MEFIANIIYKPAEWFWHLLDVSHAETIYIGIFFMIMFVRFLVLPLTKQQYTISNKIKENVETKRTQLYSNSWYTKG